LPSTSAVWTVSVTLSEVAQANASVTITNQTNNETQSADTDSAGQVIFNLANFTSGWTSGDVIETYAIYGAYEATDTRQATGNASVSLALVARTATASTRYFTTTEFLDSMQMSDNATDTENGLNVETIKLIGEAQESYIDRILGQKFDTTYTITNEYHNASGYTRSWGGSAVVSSSSQHVYFTKWTPIISLTTFQVNTASPNQEEDWVTLTAADNEITIKESIGRIQITDTSDYPAAGKDQVRITYTYGYSSVPKDIKRLAILLTAKAMHLNTAGRLGISAIESGILTSRFMDMLNNDNEINQIIQNRKMMRSYYV